MIKEKHKNIIEDFISLNAQCWISEDCNFFAEQIALNPKCDDLTADALVEYLGSHKDCLLHQIWAAATEHPDFADSVDELRGYRKAEAA